MSSRHLPGPKRDVVREENEGRRRYVVLSCGHRKIRDHRAQKHRWAFCLECPLGS